MFMFRLHGEKALRPISHLVRCYHNKIFRACISGYDLKNQEFYDPRAKDKVTGLRSDLVNL